MKYFILLTLLISLFVISGCTNGTLQVHVENAENMPLEDVSIKIQSNVSENFLITDSKGNVSIELTPRVYSAEIQKEGFNTEAIKDIQIISKKITEKNVILKEVTEESCQDLGGKICEPENSCNGKLIESTDTTNCCIGNCLEEPIESNSDKIFIAIDSGSYKNLEEEITRFTEDIKKDTKTVPILKIYNSETNKNVIKSDIKEISDGFELKGLILIGNMPFGEVRKSEYHTYPSDVYYLDIDNKCEYDQEGLIDHHSLWETCYFALSYFEIPFWVGRIKPPVSGNEGIELMRNYFNRNHAYRIGNQQYEKEMLAYLEIYEDPNS